MERILLAVRYGRLPVLGPIGVKPIAGTSPVINADFPCSPAVAQQPHGGPCVPETSVYLRTRPSVYPLLFHRRPSRRKLAPWARRAHTKFLIRSRHFSLADAPPVAYLGRATKAPLPACQPTT